MNAVCDDAWSASRADIATPSEGMGWDWRIYGNADCGGLWLTSPYCEPGAAGPSFLKWRPRQKRKLVFSVMPKVPPFCVLPLEPQGDKPRAGARSLARAAKVSRTAMRSDRQNLSAQLDKPPDMSVVGVTSTRGRQFL